MKKLVWFLLTLALVLSACGAPAVATEAPAAEVPAATEAPAVAAEPFRVAVVDAERHHRPRLWSIHVRCPRPRSGRNGRREFRIRLL